MAWAQPAQDQPTDDGLFVISPTPTMPAPADVPSRREVPPDELSQGRFHADTPSQMPAPAGGFSAGQAPGGFPIQSAPTKSRPRLEGECGAPAGVAILVSPSRPTPGKTLRVLAVSESAVDAVLVVGDEAGERVARDEERHGGPPYWWSVEMLTFEPGHFRAKLARLDGSDAACSYFDVEVREEALGPAPPLPIFWPVERQWDRDYENLYSAWVERLFDAPLDTQPTWHNLHEVTRDTSRNLLHDHLGLGEDDDGGLRLEPDCADLPFFLRGYFAWKLRLPFGFSTCFSVAPGKPPTCSQRHTNLDVSPRAGELQRMQRFFSREVGWTVHSATGRTAADDENGDLYPTNLSPTALRPGTVFADPYGHVLVVARRVEQATFASGLLLAVDAQPDKTVARKQYWRGNFLFAIDPALGGAGFKHFRPVVYSDGELRALSNEELLVHPDYGDYSFEQYASGVDGFYDRVDEVLSPEPRTVDQVFGDLIEALDQQVRGRVLSVSNGEEYVAAHPSVIAMPEGAALFQTEGAWEDYSTPSRDLRLLIAIDVVRRFPAQVMRHPERYRLRPGTDPGDLERDLRDMLAEETAARSFDYRRSDGSTWTLRLADVLERDVALEMGYNPNDCIEIRWGAPEDSDEMSTCRRHAPAEQRRRMEGQRHWFHDRNRPST
ncbi:MAG: hypothetical protein HY899_16730 [Deltaproteobacteria bacterium]|nr:hypothetical protein [Deltaproteobacteria bacterium]